MIIRALRMAAVVLLLAGCGGRTQSVTVTAASFQFTPRSIEVQSGQAVTLTLRNTDTVEHDLQVDQLPFKMTVSEMKHLHEEMADMGHMDGAGSMSMLHVHTLPGKDDALTFTPTEPGTYTVYCDVPGHREAGMTATLVVR
jgi:uncharacterized cupredoxin-like copper-binding protein